MIGEAHGSAALLPGIFLEVTWFILLLLLEPDEPTIIRLPHRSAAYPTPGQRQAWAEEHICDLLIDPPACSRPSFSPRAPVLSPNRRRHRANHFSDRSVTFYLNPADIIFPEVRSIDPMVRQNEAAFAKSSVLVTV